VVSGWAWGEGVGCLHMGIDWICMARLCAGRVVDGDRKGRRSLVASMDSRMIENVRRYPRNGI
jgi:hypothetical protein